MVNYFLLTYALSVVGGLFYYFFIRKNARPQLQKALLLSIVLLSLSLPPIIDTLLVEEEGKVCLHQNEYISETVYYNFCPAPGEEMNMCLDIAMKEDHFCECTSISANDLLVYKAEPFYDFWVLYGGLLSNLLKSVAFLLLAWLFLKIAYLYWIIYQSEQKTLELEGKTYTLLFPRNPYPLVLLNSEKSILFGKKNSTI